MWYVSHIRRPVSSYYNDACPNLESQGSFLLHSTFFFYNMNGPLQSLGNCLLVSLDQKKKYKIKIIPECEKFTKLPRARELEAAILEQCIDYSCCIDAQNAAAEAFECDCVKCNVTGQPGGFL